MEEANGGFEALRVKRVAVVAEAARGGNEEIRGQGSEVRGQCSEGQRLRPVLNPTSDR